MSASTDDELVFRHQRLDTTKRQIRLITLHPDSTNATIKCDIAIFDVDTAPRYIALSYQWGDTTTTHSITIDAVSFEVSSNLFDFLSNFRNDTSNNSHIWIDQICIDQGNIEERNHQVQLMGQIYSNCHFVVSWLGCEPASLEAARAFKLHGNILQLRPILLNSYFERLWIVQEVLLAPKLRLLCKDIWISYDEMHDLAESVTWKDLPEVPLWLFTDAHNDDEYDDMFDINAQELGRCISRYSNNVCADPRDKVYSLLALANYPMEADYNKPVKQVFQEVICILAPGFDYDYLSNDTPHRAGIFWQIIAQLSHNMSISDYDMQNLLLTIFLYQVDTSPWNRVWPRNLEGSDLSQMLQILILTLFLCRADETKVDKTSEIAYGLYHKFQELLFEPKTAQDALVSWWNWSYFDQTETEILQVLFLPALLETVNDELIYEEIIHSLLGVLGSVAGAMESVVLHPDQIRSAGESLPNDLVSRFFLTPDIRFSSSSPLEGTSSLVLEKPRTIDEITTPGRKWKAERELLILQGRIDLTWNLYP